MMIIPLDFPLEYVDNENFCKFEQHISLVKPLMLLHVKAITEKLHVLCTKYKMHITPFYNVIAVSSKYILLDLDI